MTGKKSNRYEKLKDAYAIIDGIPPGRLFLNLLLKQRGWKEEAVFECNTIACAAGWLCIHSHATGGDFELDSGFGPTPHFDIKYKGRKLHAYIDAMRIMFGLSFQEAKDLFGIRNMGGYDSLIDNNLSDKEFWKRRVELFLDRNGAR